MFSSIHQRESNIHTACLFFCFSPFFLCSIYLVSGSLFFVFFLSPPERWCCRGKDALDSEEVELPIYVGNRRKKREKE